MLRESVAAAAAFKIFADGSCDGIGKVVDAEVIGELGTSCGRGVLCSRCERCGPGDPGC